MKKLLLLLPFLACVTTPSSISSRRAALSSGDSLTCTAQTTCICSVQGPFTSDGGATQPARDGGSPDSGTQPGLSDAGSSATDAGTMLPTWSLTTSGNRILLPNGTQFKGRGVNTFDVQQCYACSNSNSWAEQRRKADVLIQQWGVNFLRLNLQDASVAPPVYFEGLAQYVTGIRQRYPDVYILVSIWNDQLALDHNRNDDYNGAPSGAAHTGLLNKLVSLLRDEPNVLFGCSNEPRAQVGQSRDAWDIEVWGKMKACHDTIRSMEDPAKRHLIAVQGTQDWGRTTSYYVGKPIAPAGVVYELHPYDLIADQEQYLAPSSVLPLVIGEFGTGKVMAAADSEALMKSAEARGIPWLAWAAAGNLASGSGGCAPNLFGTLTARCATATITPTAWGQQVINRLAKPWGAP